ncbi:BppU family phage baseplate upper protein [Bacillus pumilus]|uniref:BppU family phage baseplate upper protein n=1 Tax=Bacillus pumilus TaxID=1408 RepID=UPI002281BA0B|nr:BppU family phage baseplate upper protein [Bacillus pumilus]MCY7617486.1 BppU family phage baseplate upper protein [Bacillus pumilus]
MIRKNGPLDFDVNAYTSSSVSTSINFWTQDRQTARLIFKLTKDGVPLPLAAVMGKLVLVMSDGSRFIRDVKIVDRVNGHAEYILSDKEIKHYGIVQAELSLYYTNDQSMSVHQFSFNISKSLIDQDIVPITEYYVDEFEALRAKINELYEESIQTIEDLRSKFDDLEKIETKQGAQDKVEAALTKAKKYTDEHANNSEIHVTQSDKTKWNSGQLFRLTQNNGKPIYKGVSETTDYNEITATGLYLIYNKGLNGPSSINAAFMIVISYENTLLQTIYDTAGRNSYYRIRKTDSTWTNWTRVLTDDELKSTWNQVTLVTGTTKHFAGNPLKFSIRLNTLHLRGSFEGIPANDTVIARFAQKPSGLTVFGGSTVGSYGSARLTLGVDGALKFDGLNANDNSKVTRIEINESIPLW